MINVKTATTAELISFFNKYSATPVKKFQDRATAERRVSAIIALLAEEENYGNPEVAPASEDMANLQEEQRLADTLSPEPVDPVTSAIVKSLTAEPAPVVPKAPKARKAPKPVAPVPTDKIHVAAQDFFSTLDLTHSVEACRKVLEHFKDITRIQLKHTAASVGINPLTARNAFDRIRGVK